MESPQNQSWDGVEDTPDDDERVTRFLEDVSWDDVVTGRLAWDALSCRVTERGTKLIADAEVMMSSTSPMAYNSNVPFSFFRKAKGIGTVVVMVELPMVPSIREAIARGVFWETEYFVSFR